MKVNSQAIELEECTTINKLISKLKTDERFTSYFNFRFLIMLNGSIIEKEEYKTVYLKESDEIKIIPLMMGG